jgi:AAA+ ATPase superfamily predicted ATPase
MPQHLSSAYEKVAIEVLWRHMDRLFPFASIGRWWDKNEEIDIVGINKDLNSILFGEVKWSEKPVGIHIYEALRSKAKRVEWGEKGRKEFFCLFSRKGFTEAMIKVAKKEGVVLFKEDMPLKIYNR